MEFIKDSKEFIVDQTKQLIKTDYLRSVYVKHSRSVYEVKDIIFFNQDGVLFSVNAMDFCEKFLGIVFDDKISKKKNEDFNLKGAYFISLGKNTFNELMCNVYINIEEIQSYNLEESINKTKYDTYTYNRITIKTANTNMKVSQIVKVETDYISKMKDFKEEVEKLLNDLSLENGSYYDNIVEFKKQITNI